ncbi:MAG: hypothetical protein LQ337_001926 [Flavoplaca oasis]|nr:MAG: hypothetical protein LQ337_001926 [Flavoplaca oasis]
MAPFNTNYQVIWKNLSTEGVTFEESKTRNYTFREPDIAPRDQFLEDMGDEVARQFLVLNPNLPREAFTFQNLIDYVARVLQAGMIHWNEKPKRWSFTVGVDNVPRERLNAGRDAKLALFYRLVELSEEKDMYYVKASVRERLSEDQTPPPDETMCTIITLLPRSSQRYGRGVLVETRKFLEGEMASVSENTARLDPETQAEVPFVETAKEEVEDTLFLTEVLTLSDENTAVPTSQKEETLFLTEDEDSTTSAGEKRKHYFPVSKTKRQGERSPKHPKAARAFDQASKTCSCADSEVCATMTAEINGENPSARMAMDLQSVLAKVHDQQVKYKAQQAEIAEQQAELEKQHIRTAEMIRRNARVEAAILSAIEAYQETEAA